MSTLLDQKYDKLFGLLDFNGNGVITQQDFEHMADQILLTFGEARTSAKGQELVQEMTNYWHALRHVADADGDGRVSGDEFRDAVHQVSDDFDTLVGPLYRACFRLADRDDDGVVSRDEFIAAEVAVGVPADAAGATFDRLTGQDGHLTMDALVAAVAQYYRDDAASDGTHLFFGPL